MNYYSTGKQSNIRSLKEAVLTGLADDGGLFMPEHIPTLLHSFFEKQIIANMPFQDIAFEAVKPFLSGYIPDNKLKQIIKDTLSFDMPLRKVGESTYAMELFHGPTMAFKDVGARFMARVMSYFHTDDKQLTVLVATSGDTGGAIASGFFNVPSINVIILYPKGKVSHIQEQQLTTWGGNIQAIEVDGVFDDCQKLVKQAFADQAIRTRLQLTSANSINIARLIPQMFYYFYAWSRVADTDRPFVFSVPSGNFGNLTAGLIAKRMGLPVSRFIASTNVNDTVPEYFRTGKYHAKPSVQTISNAMDVGNPSNISRIQSMYRYNINKLKRDVWTVSINDNQTRQTMKHVYKKYNYILDPHGAVAYEGLHLYRKKVNNDCIGVFLETAHPAKFGDVVSKTIDIKVPIPKQLQPFLTKKKLAIEIKNDFNELRSAIIEMQSQPPL